MSNYTIRISEHASDRIRERSGINKKAAQKLAERAYEQGIKHSETSGNLYRFISSITCSHKHKGTDIRLYGDKVFIFSKFTKFKEKITDTEGNRIITLVTVLQIPNNLNNRVKSIMSRKKQEEIT